MAQSKKRNDWKKRHRSHRCRKKILVHSARVFPQIFEFCSEVLAVGRGWLFVGGTGAVGWGWGSPNPYPDLTATKDTQPQVSLVKPLLLVG